MSEEQLEEQLEEKQPFPLAESLSYGAGTFLTVGLIDLLAHLGPTGLVIGGILAYVVGKHGPEVTGQVRKALPAPPSRQPEIEAPQRRGKRRLIDRALGRFPAQEETKQDAESSAPDDKDTRPLPGDSADDDTRVVDEADLDREIEEAMQAQGGKVSAIIGENPRHRLDLADNFQPDADEPLGTGVFFAAMPGAGKTVAMALFLEQYILRFALACVIFCLEGDLRSILGLCPRGMIAGPNDLPGMDYVVKHRVQLVVDLQQCRRPGEEFVNYELAGQLIARTVKELLNAQAVIAPEDRLPFLLALDETQVWAPQNPPSYLESKTAKDLLDTLTIVATRGRKYHVVPFLAAQRIAKVHKDIIAGCETRILGKTDLHNDIAWYRKYVSPEVISDQGIRSLGKGQMIVCMNGKWLLVQFHDRQSKHTSHSPHLTGALNNLVERIPPEILAAQASASRPMEAARPVPAPITPSLPRQAETNMKQSTPPAPQGNKPAGTHYPVAHSTQGRHTESAAERELRLRNQSIASRKPIELPVYREEAAGEEAPAKFMQEELDIACEQWYKGAGSIDKLRNRLEGLYGQHVTHHYARKIAEELEKQGRIQLKRAGSPLVRANG